MKKIFYEVKCPRDNGKLYTMETRIVTLPNGNLLPSPPDGCNNCNGHELCTFCTAELFKMLQKDVTLETYQKPINPLSDI